MLTHHTSYRSRSLPWGLVTTLGTLTLLLLGVGRLTMGDPGRHRSTESELQLRLQLMQRIAPPGSRVLAWRSDPVVRDVIVVVQRDPTRPADWSNVIVLWDRMSIPGVFVGIADRPMKLPLESTGTSQWRRFLSDIRVRLVPVVRPDALGLLDRALPSGIGPLFRVDACLDP